MTTQARDDLFEPQNWFRQGGGPRYLQLYRHICDAILAGRIDPDSQLPPERDLARLANVSRVTVRKAVSQLVNDGLVEQRRGAGSFVRSDGPKLEHHLSTLTSFSDYMRRRGMNPTSLVLNAGLFTPNPDESMALGLSPSDRVARVERLRSADDIPLAIELSSVPEDILPRPEQVTTSLYSVLRRSGNVPTRAVQRIGAVNLGPREAELLKRPEGTAVLQINRAGYLANGRPIEFTRGIYRPDMYDFVAELRVESAQ